MLDKYFSKNIILVALRDFQNIYQGWNWNSNILTFIHIFIHINTKYKSTMLSDKKKVLSQTKMCDKKCFGHFKKLICLVTTAIFDVG